MELFIIIATSLYGEPIYFECPENFTFTDALDLACEWNNVKIIRQFVPVDLTEIAKEEIENNNKITSLEKCLEVANA